jgi:hypothetical protein
LLTYDANGNPLSSGTGFFVARDGFDPNGGTVLTM